MTDYTTTEAYRRGQAKATADMADQPPPSRFVSVSTALRGTYRRDYWQMCRRCTHPAERCTCTCDTTE